MNLAVHPLQDEQQWLGAVFYQRFPEWATTFLQLVKHYDPKSRSLSFKDANLTNETAMALPLFNWTECSAIDFSGNPELTEIPLCLAVFDPSKHKKISFDPPTSVWSTVETQILGNGSRGIIEYARLKVSDSPNAPDFLASSPPASSSQPSSSKDNSTLPVNERKLMAVGPSAVGKTTLIRGLKDESYSHPLSTDGVDMGELALRTKAGEVMRVVVWDFAGQPLYRQTHLLFLRNPGLCLLLFKLTDDVNQSVEQLRYWCDTLRSLGASGASGSQSQALLVGTHLDRCADRAQAQQHANEVWQRLKEHLTLNEAPVLVSCADGRENKQTMNELREAILRMAQSIEVRVPKSIEVVRRALLPVADSGIPVITAKAAHEIIRHHANKMHSLQLAQHEDLREMALGALQTLGFLIIVEQQRRATHVVVNAQWVALLLATVVTTRHTWAKRGRVTYGTLTSQIWRGNDQFPPEVHPILVAILQQLKIMFAVNKQRDEPLHPSHLFFIPSSLPEHRPQFSSARHDFDTHHRVERVFRVAERGRHVPSAILPELIVQIMMRENAKMLEVWQQGGVFRLSSDAVISIQKEKIDAISILIQTAKIQTASELISELSTMVENQLNDLHHLHFDVQVPCNAHDCCFFLLDDLRACILEQQLQVQCRPCGAHSSRVDVLAPDLLFAHLGDQAFIHHWSVVTVSRLLGRGAFGRVMLGQLHDSSSAQASSSTSSEGGQCTAIAVKLLEGQQNSIANFREFQHEAYLMSLLHHPNIVRFLGVCLPVDQPHTRHHGSPALLMEVVDGGTLYDSLTDSVGLLEICKIAVAVMQTVDLFNLQSSQHLGTPDQHPCPEPLPSLDELNDGAMGRIDQIWRERVIERPATASSLESVELLSVQIAQLKTHLAAYYQGPVTRELHMQTNKLVDDVQNSTALINEQLVPIDWPLRLKLATDLAQGLAYMHSLAPPLVHRDFKSPNVFLTRRLDTIDLKTIDWSQPLAKVGDFGLSIRMLGTNELRVGGEGHALDLITPTWAAPEVLSKQGYSSAADVYAMGITMWELLTREHPFNAVPMPQLAEHVVNGGRPVVSEILLVNEDRTTRGYIQLMQRCWQQDPHQRPTMGGVSAKLRELCEEVAADVLATLPPAASEYPIQPAQRTTADVEQDLTVALIEHVSIPDPEEPRVLCLQGVGENCYWAGFTNGSVAVLQLDDGQARVRATACFTGDRHQKHVTALCYSPSQQMTMWSGAEDGRIFVWGANLESLESARNRCYQKTRMIVADSNLKPLAKVKGKAVYCVVRHGRLHLYPNEHVGPPCFEFDLCRANFAAEVLQNGNLVLTRAGRQLTLSPADRSEGGDESSVHVLRRTIDYLVQLTAAGSGLSRLATSPIRHSREFITRLEATDDATWCLTQTALVEWVLLDTFHGLHNQLRLEPNRQLAFDMTQAHFGDPRLRGVCGLAWVAPHVLWVGAANTIASINLDQAGAASFDSCSMIQSVSPCQDCHQVHDRSCGQYFSNLTHRKSASSSSAQLRETAKATECATCHRAFGLFRRQQTCQACQALLCSSCCPAPNRLCRDCSSQSTSRSSAAVSVEPAVQHLGISLQWPGDDAPRHTDAVRLLVLVKCRTSPSGFEVWTYARGGDILVWQTPSNEEGEAPNLGPVFRERVPISRETPLLTCLAQVGSQVWAGTVDGAILGWTVETRIALAKPVLPIEHCFADGSGRARPTNSIAAVLEKTTMIVLASGQETSLRKFHLSAQQ